MVPISLLRVQHRCGMCDALFGSISELYEHSKGHASDDSQGKTYRTAGNTWLDTEAGESLRERPLGRGSNV